MDEITRIFVDTSKSVFQLHGVNSSEQVVVRKKLSRGAFVAFFAKLAPTVVAMEACGSAHHWARTLSQMGHEVKLIAPQLIKPYIKRNKNDARDAEGGCEAMSRPTMRFVPVKSTERQAALMITVVRDRLVRAQTQLSNAIRGHASEFGLVAAKGLGKIEPLLARVAADESLPALARRLFAELADEYAQLQARLASLEAELHDWRRQDEAARRLIKIPGVGPVGAPMLALKTPDPAAFASGRDFAAWLGLTPKDHSTAGKLRLGAITKAGDEALRAVLVAGAMSMIKLAVKGQGSPWLVALVKRKAPKLAAVALANKIARIAWKLMVSGEDYDPKASGALRVATA